MTGPVGPRVDVSAQMLSETLISLEHSRRRVVHRDHELLFSRNSENVFSKIAKDNVGVLERVQELTIGKIEKPGVPVLPGSLHGRLRVRHVEDPNDLLVLVLVVLVSLVDDLPFDTGMLNSTTFSAITASQSGAASMCGLRRHVQSRTALLGGP